jgi:hypothetical protein
MSRHSVGTARARRDATAARRRFTTSRLRRPLPHPAAAVWGARWRLALRHHRRCPHLTATSTHQRKACRGCINREWRAGGGERKAQERITSALNPTRMQRGPAIAPLCPPCTLTPLLGPPSSPPAVMPPHSLERSRAATSFGRKRAYHPSLVSSLLSPPLFLPHPPSTIPHPHRMCLHLPPPPPLSLPLSRLRLSSGCGPLARGSLSLPSRASTRS